MKEGQFKSATILVIGDVMLDRYWWGNVTRISPEAPVPVVKLNRTTGVPGGAANVAVNIASLGAKPTLMGSIGDDEEATELKNALENSLVNTADLVVLEDRPTSVKTRIVAHGQQVVRVDREVSSELDTGSSEKVLEKILPLCEACDAIVVSDYAKGLLSPTLLQQLIERGRAIGKKVIVDPKGRDYSRYHGAFMITPNRREAAEACGIDETVKDFTRVAGEMLLERLDLEYVLITESENGMTLFGRDGSTVHYAAATHEVFDVTGAGDTVIATLSVGIAAGMAPAMAAELANIAAGIAVGQIGTSAVSMEQLLRHTPKHISLSSEANA